LKRWRDASLAAIQLLRAYMQGRSSASERRSGNIDDDDRLLEMQPLLTLALVIIQIESVYNALCPYNPNYGLVLVAYSKEADAGKRRTLAENMERWRWMPMYLGRKYLLVNIASFEVSLWEDNQKIKSWRV